MNFAKGAIMVWASALCPDAVADRHQYRTHKSKPEEDQPGQIQTDDRRCNLPSIVDTRSLAPFCRSWNHLMETPRDVSFLAISGEPVLACAPSATLPGPQADRRKKL